MDGETPESDQNQGLKGLVAAWPLGPAPPRGEHSAGPQLHMEPTHSGSPVTDTRISRRTHTPILYLAPFPRRCLRLAPRLVQKVELLFHPALPPQGGPDHWVVSADGEDLLFLKLQVYLKLKNGKRVKPVPVRGVCSQGEEVLVRDAPPL